MSFVRTAAAAAILFSGLALVSATVALAQKPGVSNKKPPASPTAKTPQAQEPQAALDKRLISALEEGDFRRGNELVKKGASVKARIGDGRTVLMLAMQKQTTEESINEDVKTGPAALVKLMLERGAEVNAQDKEGMSPLLTAVTVGNLEFVKLLIDKGAKVDLTQNIKVTPLMLACLFRHSEIVYYLIEKGADVKAKDNTGMTALVYSISVAENAEEDTTFGEDRNAVFKKLIQYGADVNGTGSDLTPLMAAAFEGDYFKAQYLLLKGAKVEGKGKDGHTPLMMAVTAARVHLAKLLLSKGADPNHTTTDGVTLLMLAVIKGSYSLVEQLIQHGAKTNVKLGDETAYDVAVEKKSVAIIELLEHLGVKE